MKKPDFYLSTILTCVVLFALCSCDNDDDHYYRDAPDALVTVKPNENNTSFYMQLDRDTRLKATNMQASPFGTKEVRALVSYRSGGVVDDDGYKYVLVNWIDSILTKNAVKSKGVEADAAYGLDPVEVIDDWVTIAEDGYLTLRFRTLWGPFGVPHVVNLLTGVNEDDPYEVEFRHNANGDVTGRFADALVAFKLSELPDTHGETVKLKLKWRSFRGTKTALFNYCTGRITPAKSAITAVDTPENLR